MSCMCGADDCPRCFPGNFLTIGDRPVYTGDLSDEEIKELESDDSRLELPDPDDDINAF